MHACMQIANEINARRINDEHRIVYRVHDGILDIAQLRYHYG